MPDVRHQDGPYPPAWKDPQGLTHPVLALEDDQNDPYQWYVVNVAACHPNRFVKADEVVTDQPTTCLVCVVISRV